VHAAFPLCPGSVPVVGTACSAVSGVAGKVAGVGVDAVFSAAGRWVASGAVWLLGQVGTAMSASTSVDLGAGWFSAHIAVMASLAAVVVLPMACCAALQAVYRQSPSMLVRTFLVYLPLSLLLTGVAVELVRMALAVTDALSSRVLSSAGVDTTNVLAPVSTFFSGVGSVEPAVPAFVIFVGGLIVAAVALVLWLELVVRAAAISAAVLFLPLSLASLVWPAVAHWCRRLGDTLVALVLSKLVIAAVLSLAAAALAGGSGQSGNASGGGFAAVVTGIALLLVATLSPFTLLRLVPTVEAGAVSHLESTRHRMQAAARAPLRARNLAMDYIATAGVPVGGGAVGSLGSLSASEVGGGAGGVVGAARAGIGMWPGSPTMGMLPGGEREGASHASPTATAGRPSTPDGADRSGRGADVGGADVGGADVGGAARSGQMRRGVADSPSQRLVRDTDDSPSQHGHADG
jgi:hypothetical protein